MSERRWVLLTFALALALCLALYWPLPLHMGARWSPSAFGETHAWAADAALAALLGERPLSSAAGYPFLRDGRLIGLPVMPLTWLLSLVGGPLAAAQLTQLLALPLSALGAWPLLRRWTTAPPSALAAACLAYAFCPYLLGTLAIGELPKLQAWTLPLCLWAYDKAATGEPRAPLYAALLTAVAAFTSPYYGLALPLLAGLVVARRAWQRLQDDRQNDGPRWAWARAPATTLAATALGLLGTYLYFVGADQPVQLSLFRPAQAGEAGSQLPLPHPVATPSDLLFGPELIAHTPWEVDHVPTLGLALLIGLTAIGLRRGFGKGWRWGAALALLGVTLALGPNLALGERFTALPLPAMLLLKAGYPLARGGMWFRLVLIASLGLSLLLASAHQRPGGRGLHPALLWLLLGLHVSDGLRVSGEWPRPVLRVEGLAQLRAMADGGETWPSDGAVLHLPLQEGRDAERLSRHLLAATIHRRPTTALPRDVLSVERRAVEAELNAALASGNPQRALRELGYRYVILEPGGEGNARELLRRRLGAPEGSLSFSVWELGATTLKPRPLEAEMLPGGAIHR